MRPRHSKQIQPTPPPSPPPNMDTSVLRTVCFVLRNLDKSEKVIFIFNNIDPYVCKKLGYYVYEAFQLRNLFNETNAWEIEITNYYF